MRLPPEQQAQGASPPRSATRRYRPQHQTKRPLKPRRPFDLFLALRQRSGESARNAFGPPSRFDGFPGFFIRFNFDYEYVLVVSDLLDSNVENGGI